jgi:hypothetical protein
MLKGFERRTQWARPLSPRWGRALARGRIPLGLNPYCVAEVRLASLTIISLPLDQQHRKPYCIPMNAEASLATPANFEGWAKRLQCIGGPEPVLSSGVRITGETTVKGVPFPPNLIGMSAVYGSIFQVGDEDSGYKLRARGHFPSRQQAVYVVQRVQPTSRRPEDFWIGVMTDKPSIQLHFQPIWRENDYIPGPDQLASATSRYMRLEPEEYAAFGDLIYLAATQGNIREMPQYNSTPDWFV